MGRGRAEHSGKGLTGGRLPSLRIRFMFRAGVRLSSRLSDYRNEVLTRLPRCSKIFDYIHYSSIQTT
jgi:hypothetical protein